MIRPVVLAAGSSTRLGRPKALMELAGKPALERIVAACASGGCGRAVVVLGSDAKCIVESCDLSGVTVVVHAGWAAGRTSSLKAGLRAIGDPAAAFLIFPVDHPLVAGATVSAIRAAWNRKSPDVRLAQPVFKGRRGHPVLCAGPISEEILVLGDDEPASNVTRRDPSRVLEVPVDDPAVVENIDTPEDLENARNRLRSPSG